MDFVVILTALFFWAIYSCLFVIGDSGLYLTAWHRSILANFKREKKFNRSLASVRPYDSLDQIFNADNDQLYNQQNQTVALATFDRQDARPYGPSLQHMDFNYQNCANLRKVLALANTSPNEEINMQQLLSDQTLNYFYCILSNRFANDIEEQPTSDQ